MGDSFRLTRPAAAGWWYRKAISITKEMSPVYEVRYWLAERDEALAEVLVNRQEAPERLQLLREANAIRIELARTGPDRSQDRLHLMRSYCNLSDAEITTSHPGEVTRNADSAVPFLNEFKVTSPSLVVLRDVGLCYESLGNAYRSAALNQSLPLPERRTLEAEAQQWYLKSSDAWNEWVRRGVATPESETERHIVQRLIHAR
jgi:hypothetical protein